MSVGDIVGLLFAVGFLVLVGFLAMPLYKLGKVLEQAAGSLKEVTEHTVPVIDEAAITITTANGQLSKVDTVTTAAAETTQNVSAMTSLVAATVGAPLVKMAAFSLAVRGLFKKAPTR